jgi:hypothetical protein
VVHIGVNLEYINKSYYFLYAFVSYFITNSDICCNRLSLERIELGDEQGHAKNCLTFKMEEFRFSETSVMIGENGDQKTTSFIRTAMKISRLANSPFVKAGRKVKEA